VPGTHSYEAEGFFFFWVCIWFFFVLTVVFFGMVGNPEWFRAMSVCWNFRQ
jgi:hypothetical protein